MNPLTIVVCSVCCWYCTRYRCALTDSHLDIVVYIDDDILVADVVVVVVVVIVIVVIVDCCYCCYC